MVFDLLLHPAMQGLYVLLGAGFGLSALVQLLKRWLVPLRRRQLRSLYRQGRVVVVDSWWWQAAMASLAPLLSLPVAALAYWLAPQWWAPLVLLGGLSAPLVYWGVTHAARAAFDGVAARLRDRTQPLVTPSRGAPVFDQGPLATWESTPTPPAPAGYPARLEIDPARPWGAGYDDQGEEEEP